MPMKIALFLAMLVTPAFAQGQADPTMSKVGDPSGAIRSLSNSSEDKPGKQTTQVPRGATTEGDPRGAPAGTSGPSK